MKREKREQKTGAKLSSISWQARFRAYKKDHQRVLRDSLQRLLKKPITSAMTWLVIGIALALPVAFYVAVGNLHQLSEHIDSDAQVSLFLHAKTPEKAAQALLERLQQQPEILQAVLINKDQALQEFQALSGFADVLDHLKQNPLPFVIELKPSAEHAAPHKVQVLLAKLEADPLVDIAQLDLQWVQRLNAMLILAQRIAFGLVLLLSLGVLLVIANTTRLEVESRRDEIVIVKLVGATDSFVRRPFLYTGIWFGLGGGVIASLIVALGLAVLDQPAKSLAGLYDNTHTLLGLSLLDTLWLWVMSGLLGFFGAWFALNRHLDELEPG